MRKLLLLLGLWSAVPLVASDRVMTIRDVLELRSNRGGSLTTDGHWYIYSLCVPDVAAGTMPTDLYLRNVRAGTVRQMTFTPKHTEETPIWHPSGEYFAFRSNRSGKTQVYAMRPDGGEAWAITDDSNGIGNFAFSRDGRFLAFTGDKADTRQLFLYDVSAKSTRQLTQRDAGVTTWFWSPDDARLFFLSQDGPDHAIRERNKKKYTVRIRDEEHTPVSVWEVSVALDPVVKRLWGDSLFSAVSMTISENSRYLGILAASAERHADTYMSREIFLYDTQTGENLRITQNDVPESGLVFAPDSRSLAFGAPWPPEFGRNDRLHVADVEAGTVRVIAKDYDYDVTPAFWDPNGDGVVAAVQQGESRNLVRFDLHSETARMITNREGDLSAFWHRESWGVVLTMQDGSRPVDTWWSRWEDLARSGRWRRLTDSNPQVRKIALGTMTTIHWTSSDGAAVGGVLITPPGFRPGRPIPLIVQLHGGPASAFLQSFPDGYKTYSHVFAGLGYAVFQPNYRGSTGYGEHFTRQIAGDYFRQAYDDIMAGVDALIDQGVAHPDSLGVMGWSAGGHWSNWILVSTDRFKAISSGAGAVNWVSLYAQTDVQSTREFYFQGRPYDNMDHYVKVSPLTYINNARTPTLIHFGDRDQRIPRPQGDELYMALKKLHVPTEYIVYPGQPHGLNNLRYQQVKMEADVGWFEKWIRGRDTWIDWQAILADLEPDVKP